MKEILKLLNLCLENGVKVEFLDYKNSEHKVKRRQLVYRSYALIYADMTLDAIKKELERKLRDNGIEPWLNRFDEMKNYYENWKRKLEENKL